MSKVTPEELDAVLPQTQCGLCGYGGCMPYAEAMIFENAAINLCPPGGTKTLAALATILEQDAANYLAEMAVKAKPKLQAVIREAECIGCTKCIQACPVDAILGSAKQMHTVITDECTGCELCVAPCPVDCIDLLPATAENVTTDKAAQYRQRFLAREVRMKKAASAKKLACRENTATQRNAYIHAALARVRAKKNQPR